MQDEGKMRRSLRLSGYDYSLAGGYFVRLCSAGRCSLFGRLVGGKIELSEIGKIVAEEWQRLPRRFPGLELGEFVLMPDHLHGILLFVEDRKIKPPGRSGPQAGSLGAIIGQFKSQVTKRVWSFAGSSHAAVWQRNYYEHIIRDEADWVRIHEYIRGNPTRPP